MAEVKKYPLGAVLKDAKFTVSATEIKGYPVEPLPEIAFAGRSNVGKSSLINALCNKRQVAKVSNTPGKTRLINFYDLQIAQGRLRLVDLPGYGYAKVSKTEKESWKGMISEYLFNRETLAMVVLLVDSRLEMQESDKTALAMCRDRGLPHIIGATKCDKLPKNELFKSAARIAKDASLEPGDVFMLSSETMYGVAKLWQSFIDAIF